MHGIPGEKVASKINHRVKDADPDVFELHLVFNVAGKPGAKKAKEDADHQKSDNCLPGLPVNQAKAVVQDQFADN